MTPALRPLRPEAHALSQVLDAVPGRPYGVETAGSDPVVTGITHDSRCVAAGDLYVALPGAHTHGARHCGQAVRAGAVAVLTDPSGAAAARACGVAVVVVADPRAILGALASAVYGHPSRRLRLLGVTGTNGKTTVSYLLEAGLRAEGQRTGLVGTVETRLGDDAVPSVRTTPEATDLHALFAVMVERGVTAAAMEVSSHALAFGRAGGVSFAGAAFTNLTQDHLDFHADMADYFQAKSSLFRPEVTALSVVNADDAYGRLLLAARPPHPVSFGVREHADWRAVDVRSDAAGSRFARAGTGGAADPGVSAAARRVQRQQRARSARPPRRHRHARRGRSARESATCRGYPGGWSAWTPASRSPRSWTTPTPPRPSPHCWTWCGRSRRAGSSSSSAAGVTGTPASARSWVPRRRAGPTSSCSPTTTPARRTPLRSSRPWLRGRARSRRAVRATVLTEPDRAGAIALAVSHARRGDTVVVAGKGHERGQEQGGVVTPFDDREVLRSALSSGSAA